jgi:hypothetical protein
MTRWVGQGLRAGETGGRTRRHVCAFLGRPSLALYDELARCVADESRFPKKEAQRQVFERCGGVPSTTALRFEAVTSKRGATLAGGRKGE